MPKFIVETLQTFREVHIVEAETREDAEFIALNSDYNASYYLGSQILETKRYETIDHDRFREKDEYFWEGVKSINADGYLVYDTPVGCKITDEKLR